MSLLLVSCLIHTAITFTKVFSQKSRCRLGIQYLSKDLKLEVGVMLCSDIYIYIVLQTIQMKSIFLCVWAERAFSGSSKTALKYKYI